MTGNLSSEIFSIVCLLRKLLTEPRIEPGTLAPVHNLLSFGGTHDKIKKQDRNYGSIIHPGSLPQVLFSFRRHCIIKSTLRTSAFQQQCSGTTVFISPKKMKIYITLLEWYQKYNKNGNKYKIDKNYVFPYTIVILVWEYLVH